MAPICLYDVAVPAATYSCSTYPTRDRSARVGDPMYTPLPPAISCEMSAVGPDGGGCVVAVGPLVVAVLLVVRVESAFLPVSLEQAAAPSSATIVMAIA